MKKISKILCSLVVAFLFSTNVKAATGSMSVTSNARVAVVGSTFNVTVTVSSNEALGSWTFGLAYDSSYVAYQSGPSLTVADYSDGTKRSTSYVYTFKALKSGTASIRVQDGSMASWNDPNVLFYPSISNATVTIKTQAEIQASYSKDNYLKSITVEGYEISPEFDKDTLEYSVAVPDTVEQIKVSALVNDYRSRVTGTGTIDISEGANKIELVVTAENGSVKTYTLNVDVKDLNPIDVNVGGENYTVVKKDTLLTEPVGFTKTTIKMGEEEVPAFKNDRADLTVLGLKDSNGKVGMFLYDEDSKTYSKYNELKNSSLILLPIEIESVPEGFNKDTLTINGTQYEVMKSEVSDDLYIIYAMNIESGEKDYYQFDKDTNAFIKYNSKVYEALLQTKKEYTMYLIACGVGAGVFFLLAIAMARRVSKLKKLLRKVTSNKEEKVVPQKVEETIDTTKEESSEENSDLAETSGLPTIKKESESVEEETDEDFLELDNRRKKKKRKR